MVPEQQGTIREGAMAAAAPTIGIPIILGGAVNPGADETVVQ